MEVSLGRIVHYVLEGTLDQIRPAIVVQVWPESVNLIVFLDGGNDRYEDQSYTQWVTSVKYCESKPDGQNWPARTWHWPERI